MNMKIYFSNKMGTNRIIFIKFQYSVAWKELRMLGLNPTKNF